MKFRCKVPVEKRLTAGKIYQGNVVTVPSRNAFKPWDLRIAVFDDGGYWMTFDPQVFIPYQPKPGEQI